MKKCDTIFNNKHPYSLDNAFSEMFECIDENGILCVRNFPDDELNVKGYIKCQMEFSEEEKQSALEELKQIKSHICDIADIADKDAYILKSDFENLSQAAQQTYYTYISPLDMGTDNIEEIDRLHNKWCESASFAEFTPEEKEFVTACRRAEVADANKRIGDNYCAFDVIRRAQRFYRLLTLKAPKVIYEQEEFLMLKAFLIHKFAKSYTVEKNADCKE